MADIAIDVARFERLEELHDSLLHIHTWHMEAWEEQSRLLKDAKLDLDRILLTTAGRRRYQQQRDKEFEWRDQTYGTGQEWSASDGLVRAQVEIRKEGMARTRYAIFSEIKVSHSVVLGEDWFGEHPEERMPGTRNAQKLFPLVEQAKAKTMAKIQAIYKERPYRYLLGLDLDEQGPDPYDLLDIAPTLLYDTLASFVRTAYVVVLKGTHISLYPQLKHVSSYYSWPSELRPSTPMSFASGLEWLGRHGPLDATRSRAIMEWFLNQAPIAKGV